MGTSQPVSVRKAIILTWGGKEMVLNEGEASSLLSAVRNAEKVMVFNWNEQEIRISESEANALTTALTPAPKRETQPPPKTSAKKWSVSDKVIQDTQNLLTNNKELSIKEITAALNIAGNTARSAVYTLRDKGRVTVRTQRNEKLFSLRQLERQQKTPTPIDSVTNLHPLPGLEEASRRQLEALRTP